VVMHDRPVGRGYVHLAENAEHPWPRPNGRTDEIRAHEFHYSSLENLPTDTRFAYRVTRGHGIDGQHDGLIYKNLLASYTHLRTIGSCYWASRFVAFARRAAQSRQHDFAAHQDNIPAIHL
jgi:cobyrinic acid a,c-diamide synthase